MPEALWDASALIKRYYTEAGTATVDAVFASVLPVDMAATFLGYTECAAILRRRFNSGALDQAAFSGARLLLRQEVLNRRCGHPGGLPAPCAHLRRPPAS